MAAILLGHRRRSIITMALCTVINDTGMIKHRWFKGTGYVTEAAVLRGRDVQGILHGSYWSSSRIITMTC